MSAPESSDGRPLLRPCSPTSSSSSSSSEVKYSTITPPTPSEDEITSESLLPQRLTSDVPLPESSPLGRTLTWSSSFILVISRVIGSGIFATPGTILTAVHSPGLALLLWLVGAVIAACGLAVSLEFGTMLPRSGGDKVYLEFVYRRPRFLASTLIAVHAVLLGFTASNCIVFSRYVLFAFGWEDTAGSLAKKAVAVGLLCAITVLHVVFPRAGVRLQDGLGWIKIGLVMFMILSGMYAILVMQPSESYPGARSQLAWDGLWEGSVWNWGIVSTSLFKVFYSYAGLDNVNNVLNEVKNPVRTVRSVTLTALATACGMYLLVNVAYMLVVPLEEIRGSGELIAALFFERVFGVRLGRRILPLAVATSAAGNVLVVAFAMARLKQEIARQGFLPFSETLSTTKPFGSPIGGFAVHFIPSFLVIVLPPSETVYSFILELEQYPAQIISLLISFGLLWLRVKQPDLKRPFKAWLPAVFVKIALSFALLAAPFVPPAEKPENGIFYATYAVVGASIIVAAVMYWCIWTVLVPRWRGYKLEEETEVLSDGISVTKLVHVYS